MPLQYSPVTKYYVMSLKYVINEKHQINPITFKQCHFYINSVPLPGKFALMLTSTIIF